MKNQKYRKRIEEALPDSFTMMANAMKAGMSLPQALALAAEESPSPLKEIFQNVLEGVKLGRSFEEALLVEESQLKIPDFSLMVHSILILRQTGGNFVAHFENLSQVLRERKKVSSRIRLFTTQGTTQGIILSLMPLGLSLALFLLSPDFIAPLWQGPLGWMTFLMILMLDLGGWFWMKRLAKVEV